MSANDLKKHTAKVGTGSGCVFQPMDDKSTYILTAKHLFQHKNQVTGKFEEFLADGSKVPVIFLEFDGNSWNSTLENFTMEFEENFFPHQDADAAILKIPLRKGYDNIHVRRKRVKNGYHLCGFPGYLQFQPTLSSQYDSQEIQTFLHSDDFFELAQLETSTINYSEIEGFSGGGLMTFDDNKNVFLTGIQSRMAKEKLNLDFGKIGFVPIEYFEEITDTYKADGKLEELLPVFIKSFVSLIGETFQFASAGINRKEAALSDLLIAKAQFIQQSDLTPMELKSFLGEQRLLIKNQDSIELKRKKVWTFWLELLVILNIVKEKVLKKGDLTDILSKIRFFYSDTDKPFLTEHLEDLWKLDYKDLKDEGLVIYASKQVYPRRGTEGVLNLSEIILDISSARREFHKKQNQSIDTGTIDIAEAKEFPFDRFKYTSLTTFKENAVHELEADFLHMKPADCYPLLKELYERLLP